jgi:hypothetical protein
MMSAFRLHTLKQKLWAIVVVSFVARVIMFFALPSTPSSLAPDEGTYAALARWISESKPATGFGEESYLSGRSVIIPASTLIKFGMNELDAVRVTSSIYGFLSLCLLAYLCSKFSKSKAYGFERNIRIEQLVSTLLIVYAFFPSHFIWSNLGLRESPNEFWLIMAFASIFLMLKEGQPKKLLLAPLVSVSIICTFSSRPQVGWVLVVAILIYSLFNLRNKTTYLLLISVLTGLFAGYLATTSLAIVTRDVYVAKNKSTISINASKLCDGNRTKVEYKGKIYVCVKSGTLTNRVRTSNIADVVFNQVELLPGKQSVNQVGATSMIERLTCPWAESSELGKYGCLAFRAPYMTLTFLFRPLPFVDTTSLASTFAACENVLWIFMFVVIIRRIFALKRIPFFKELAPAIVFFILYVVGAGSYEGNMGTAFRHKSLILWVLLLLIFALTSRKPDEVLEKQGIILKKARFN